MCGRRWISYYNNERFWKTMLLALAGLLVLQYTISLTVVTRRSRVRLGGAGYHREDCSGATCQAGQDTPSGGLWSWVEGVARWVGLVSPTTPPLPPCPAIPPNLTGPIPVSFQRYTLEEIDSIHPELPAGGRWSPPDCKPASKVAIIVPYRDREEHLRIWINNIHEYLQKQQRDYGIYIIEQDPNSTFNRGLLMNIGFLEAQRFDKYSCFIFHDVDLLPEDDRNLYECSSQPRHMSASIDSLAYRLPYDTLFGGVEAFKKEQFEKVNGFSNKFFGWGGEDDDLYNRLQYHGMNITRYPMRISRYRMIRHLKRDPSPHRLFYLNSGSRRYHTDGLNSVLYKRLQLDRRKLFTLISVQINETEILNQGSEDERDLEFEMFAEIKLKMENEKKENVAKIIAKIRQLYASKLPESSVNKLTESASVFLNKEGSDGYQNSEITLLAGNEAQQSLADQGQPNRLQDNRALLVPINPEELPSSQHNMDDIESVNEQFPGANVVNSIPLKDTESSFSKAERHVNIQRLVDEQLSPVKYKKQLDSDAAAAQLNNQGNGLVSGKLIISSNGNFKAHGDNDGYKNTVSKSTVHATNSVHKLQGKPNSFDKKASNHRKVRKVGHGASSSS